PRRATELADGLPGDIDRFFERAFSWDREGRFASAEDMGRALASLEPGAATTRNTVRFQRPPEVTVSEKQQTVDDAPGPAVRTPLLPRRFWPAMAVLAVLAAALIAYALVPKRWLHGRRDARGTQSPRDPSLPPTSDVPQDPDFPPSSDPDLPPPETTDHAEGP